MRLPRSALLAAVWLVPALSGCGFIEPKTAQGPRAGAFNDAAPATAPFEPVQLRLHPLTGISRHPDQPAQDEATIHIELLDAWGDTVKALGQLRLELAIEAPGFAGSGGANARAWELDLRDPARNSERFDRVTRTYRVGVQGPPRWDPARQRARLTASMTLPSGAVLRSERVLEGSP